MVNSSRQVTLSKDQIIGGFIMQVTGMLSITLQHVPPHELADVLMQQAARLLAGIDPDQARQTMAERIAESFKLSVETNAAAMRMTPGGVVLPEGFKG